MTTTAYSTQGSKLYFPDTSVSPVVVNPIAQMTGFTGLGGKKTKIDITTQDSDSFKEYAGGLMDAGELSFDLIFDFTNANQALIFTLAQSANATRSFFFGASDATTAPTYSAPNLVPPNGGGLITRSGFLFRGYFSMFQVDAPLDNVIKVKSGVQQTGGITIYKKGASYP